MSFGDQIGRAARCVPIIFATACIGQVEDDTGELIGYQGEALVHWSSSVNPPQRGPIVSGAIPRLFADSNHPDVILGVNNTPPELNKAPLYNGDTLRSDLRLRSDTTAEVFDSRLADAITDARNFGTRVDDQWLETAEDVERFADLVNVEVEHTTPLRKEATYVPEQARWLDKEENTNPPSLLNYNDPPGYFELRQRGALTYCAAKQAYANGGGRTQVMGRKSLADITVMGKKISFFTLEPTIALAAPRRSSSSSTNDGAQAFAIPMTAGVRVAPISLLPTLPEIRTPVTYVMGDTEVITQSNVTASKKRWWQTSTHADMFVSSQRKMFVDPKPITLFQIGPVPVTLDMEFDLHTVSCPYGGVPNNGNVPLTTCMTSGIEWPYLAVPRLYGSAVYPGYPATRKGGDAGSIGDVAYNDDFWVFSGQNAQLGGSSDQWIYNVLSSPLYPRAYLDNDKQMEIRTGLRAKAALGLSYEAEDVVPYVGSFRLEIRAEGELIADADVIHTVRDEVIATKRGTVEFTPWKPEATLSVTPRTEVTLSGGVHAEAWLHVELPVIGHVEIGGTIFEAEFATDVFPSKSWPESNRLRITTLSSWSQPTSHWPNGGHFQALGEPLSTCMTNAAPTGHLQANCPSVRGSYPGNNAALTAPETPLCVVAPIALRPDYDDGETQCANALARFVNGGTSALVPPLNTRRARVIDTHSATDLKAALDLCARAGCSKDEINGIVDVAMCTSMASAPAQPVVLTGDAQDGPDLDMGPNACQ